MFVRSAARLMTNNKSGFAWKRAEQWVARGLGAADAAHLAFAEESQADFVTVDDHLL